MTWISIYWFSRAGAGATTRIYHEVFGDTNEMQDSLDASKRPQDIPFGVSRFPKEVQVAPKAYVVIFPELFGFFPHCHLCTQCVQHNLKSTTKLP